MSLNYMMSEREYNAGGTEFSVQAEIDSPDIPGGFTWSVEIVYEVDRNQVKPTGVWASTGDGDEDYLHTLTPEQYDQVLGEAVDHYAYVCDMEEGRYEDYLEGRHE